MGKLNFNHVEEPSKTFFSRIVGAFPAASFQLVTGVIEDREMLILRIASPSGDSRRSLDFYSTDMSGDILEFAGWHVHVEDLHADSNEIAFASLCTLIAEILDGKKGVRSVDTPLGPSLSLVQLSEEGAKGVVVWS